MTDQTPTGVFVRLPLSDEQREDFITSMDCGEEAEQALLAIGTPVTHEELYPVGYINEDAIVGIATGIYQSASIFREEDREHYDTVALVRLSEAQALLAERGAEIARLRNSARLARENIKDGSPMKAAYVLEAALKGPEA